MRIALVAQEDPFYLPPAVMAICEARKSDVVALVVLKSFNETMRDTARRLYEFYGATDFARLAARYAKAKLINRFGRCDRPYSVSGIASRLDIPLYTPEKVNSPEFLETLRTEIKPDLILSVAASQVFRRRLLSIPPLGCINIHSAPLPKYQGMMPVFWTLYHGEKAGCVTIHYMDVELDAGDIILQRSVDISPTDSLEDLMIRSKEVGVTAVLEALDMIEHDRVQRIKMDTSRASYFSFPKRIHAADLRARGRRLLR
jgi:methionyl-tRNA formyltransferase